LTTLAGFPTASVSAGMSLVTYLGWYYHNLTDTILLLLISLKDYAFYSFLLSI